MADDRDIAAGMLRDLAHQLRVIGRPDLMGAADLGADAIGRLGDEIRRLEARVAELEGPATIPDCPSIVEAFAELAEAAGDANWDDILAEKEAERQGRHELAAVLTTTDGRVLGFEDMEGCREFMATADRDLLGTVWTREGAMAEARDWLARRGHGGPFPNVR